MTTNSLTQYKKQIDALRALEAFMKRRKNLQMCTEDEIAKLVKADYADVYRRGRQYLSHEKYVTLLAY